MTWHLEAAGHAAFRGRFWRMLAPRWAFDPLSGAGAARAGGRWNAPGQAALYFSDSHATAIAEYQQNLPRPGTLTAYDVDARDILDLCDPAVRQVRRPGQLVSPAALETGTRRPRSATILLGLRGCRRDGRMAGFTRALCTGSRNEPGAMAVERNRCTRRSVHRPTLGFAAQSGLLAKLTATIRVQSWETIRELRVLWPPGGLHISWAYLVALGYDQDRCS